jgi:NAD(P)-dependent dehydrogenase (short-subunit alcohol dehydrogenase family)
MDLHLKGKRAAILGGTRGIGRAIAEGLVAEGASLAICARNKVEVEAAVAAFEKAGTTAYGETLDIADGEGVKAFVGHAAESLGGLDIAIANATASTVGNTTIEWKAMLDIDILGLVSLIEAAQPFLEAAAAKHGDAAILAISSVSAPGPLTTNVSAANGRSYAGILVDFYAFDAVTGAVVPGYPKDTEDTIYSTPALNSGQVFFGDDSGRLYGLRASDGSDLSGFPVSVSSRVVSSPVVGAGRVVFGSSDGKVYSVAVGDGSVLWSKTLDDVVFGDPVTANGIVYVNSQSSLYALDFASGDILWRAGVSTAQGRGSPAVSDGIVFIGSKDGSLYAFSVNGRAPASRLPGGEFGVRPALSSLKPDFSLRASQ